MLLAAASASLFAVEHSPGLVVGEDQGYVITLTDANNGTPVEAALVEAYGDEGVIAQGATGADGSVHFFLHPGSPGFIAFRATADGYNEYVVVEEVTVPDEPAPAYSTPTPKPNVATNPITGFITLNPTESSIFYFGFAAVIASLFGATYIFYLNYIMEEETEAAWDVTRVIESAAAWLKGD